MKFLSLSINGTTIPTPSGIPTGGLGPGESGQKLLMFAVELIFVMGIALAVIFILLSGIQWIISGGDKEKLSKARARLTYAIIGLVVILSAFFIVSVVISLLGGNISFFFTTSTGAPGVE